MYLPPEFKIKINAISTNPNVRLILVTESNARQSAKAYSDFDILVLMALPGGSFEPYNLKYFGDLLLSISYSTVREWEEKLRTWKSCKYLQEPLLDATVLFEFHQGNYDDLTEFARNTGPESFIEERQQLVKAKIVGYVEGVDKVLKVVDQLRSGKQISTGVRHHSFMGIFHGDSTLISNYPGLEVVSENDIFVHITSALPKKHNNLVSGRVILLCGTDSWSERREGDLRLYIVIK